MKPKSYFKNGKCYVWKERFAIVKAKKPILNSLATIADKDEVTVVIDQKKITSEDIIKIKKGWKVITIDIIFRLDVVGVMAKISNALAKK